MMLEHRLAVDMMMIHGGKLEWRHLDYHLYPTYAHLP